MKYDHYKKDVRHLEMIDVYRVIELFGVTHPALQHALKKVLCAGDRGAKDWEKDVREAVESLNRALEMRAEDAGDNHRRASAAEKTLSGMGFFWNGGELWKPPLGEKPGDQTKAREQIFGGQQSERRDAILQDPLGWLKRRGCIDFRDLAELAPQESEDPHAELRKTWKPGQRWQFRWRHLMEDWREVSQESSPRWSSSCEYRRHPDDIKDGE